MCVVVALLAPFALVMLAILGASVVAGENVSLESLGRSREIPQFSALGFLAYNIVSFGYGEEVGWRGFALPRLQTRHSAFVATLLLTLGWALWHLPLFFYRPGYTSMDVAGVVGWFFSLLTGALLLTWFYNESQGSILVVALFHAAVDVVFTSEIASPFVVNASGALITIWGIIVLVGAGPRYLSRRGKMVSLDDGGAVNGFVHRDGQAFSTAAQRVDAANGATRLH
jgi:membrane protease YdiL (CAAX protease family)